MATSKIQKYSMPTVVLPPLFIADVQTDAGKISNQIKHDELKPSNYYGNLFPLIQINGRIFEPMEISKFELDCTGEIPRISVLLTVYDNYFISKKFPRDGGVVSIFISSKDNSFTPIRNDYLITSISSSGNDGFQEGSSSTIRIGGVLDLPLLTGEVSKAVNDTSFNTMKTIAKDLKLGFASNVSLTNDSMNWICPYDTYSRWMHDVTLGAYSGENSFYKFFVDQYYFLNFIDLNLPYSESLTLDDGLLVDAYNNTIDTSLKAQKTPGKILLTNFQYFHMTNFHIQKYHVINNAGDTANTDGYTRVLQFWDRDTNQNFNLPVDNLITQGNQSLDTLKGRTSTEKTQKTKYVWLGLSDTDNVHENYTWAQINNFQNNRHVNKMQLKVELAIPNFNLYRGMRVPVMITYSNDEAKVASEKAANEGPTNVTTDKFLSGYYVIVGMKYNFSNTSAKFLQEITLSRREWPKVLSTADSNTTIKAPTQTNPTQ